MADADEQGSLEQQQGYRQLQNISLGGVAATYKEVSLPKKYRAPKPGERSTFQGAGILPVCRKNGETVVLLMQPQRGKKVGVRWWDFGGRKLNKGEFASRAACRKFAKQTYGLFGIQTDWDDPLNGKHLGELFHDLANVPLMLHASREWAQGQLLDDCGKTFYNDQHEYHVYLLNVPYIPAEVLDQASKIVDDGKRLFLWITPEEFLEEALAGRLHIDGVMRQMATLDQETWVKEHGPYGQGRAPATASFQARELTEASQA